MKVPQTELTAQQGEALAQLAFSRLSFTVRPQGDGDYGLDHHAELVENGCASGRLLALQVKAGNSYFAERDDDRIVFRIDSQHVHYWMNHSLPVVICLCDLEQSQVYWQSVNHETAISTGKGYKIIVPVAQKVDQLSKNALCQILTPAVSGSLYTALKDEDQSIAGVERVSIKALTNGHMTKAAAAAIVRRITGERSLDSYHYAAGAGGDNSAAQVVWTYLYLTAEDYANSNHYCSSLWIHDRVPHNLRPISLDGENIGHGITMCWNPSYAEMARLLTSSLTKTQYLTHANPIIAALPLLTEALGHQIDSLSWGNIDEDQFLSNTSKNRTSISQIQQALHDLPYPPFECSEMDHLLQAMIANLANVALIYSERGMTIWTRNARLHLATQQIRSTNETLYGFQYEIAKLR